MLENLVGDRDLLTVLVNPRVRAQVCRSARLVRGKIDLERTDPRSRLQATGDHVIVGIASTGASARLAAIGPTDDNSSWRLRSTGGP
jgi:hypothetical protein